MKWIVVVALSFLLPAPLTAKDSDEPFTDPADSNPAEGLRRSGRMMSRLRDSKNIDEIKKIQQELEDRMTRTLLTMERKAQSQSSNSSNGGSSSKKPNKDSSGKRPKPKDREQDGKQNNASSQPKPNQPKPDDGKPNNGKQDPDSKNPGDNATGGKTKVNQDSERWGTLPPKIRDALRTNLGRDVPAEIEEDMRDFTERMKELD